MKVIYEYDEQSTQLLANVDKAINIYLEEFEKEIRKSTLHIRVTEKYIQDKITYDFKYQRLLTLKKNILDHAIPKFIIIESKESITKVDFNEINNSQTAKSNQI